MLFSFDYNLRIPVYLSSTIPKGTSEKTCRFTEKTILLRTETQDVLSQIMIQECENRMKIFQKLHADVQLPAALEAVCRRCCVWLPHPGESGAAKYGLCVRQQPIRHTRKLMCHGSVLSCTGLTGCTGELDNFIHFAFAEQSSPHSAEYQIPQVHSASASAYAPHPRL